MSKLLDCLGAIGISATFGCIIGIVTGGSNGIERGATNTSNTSIAPFMAILCGTAGAGLGAIEGLQQGGKAGLMGSVAATVDQSIKQNITDSKPIQYVLTGGLAVFLDVFCNELTISSKLLAVGVALYLKCKWDSEEDITTELDGDDCNNNMMDTTHVI